MDGVLSQEEISALLNNPDDANKNDLLTDAEKDAIGEIGNISMGTAATTLFSLVNRKVDISTPVVSFAHGVTSVMHMKNRVYLSELHIQLVWMEVIFLF